MIRLVAVGKVKSGYYRDGIADYERRLSRYGRLSTSEIRDSNPQEEGDRILAQMKGSPVVACDVTGELWDSQRLAKLLGEQASPCFIIGGPDGLSQAVRDRADYLLQLSGFTLPHELARLVLVEQLYRAFTILRGHPYHR
jgi:23S rRNA (pseudouridine1915-N3)-methyltransferase